MALASKHIVEQGRVITALGRLAAAAVKQNVLGQRGRMVIPGPLIHQTVVPPSPELISDYIRAVGGSPKSYRGTIPAHLFPQWAFPLVAKSLEGIDYPIHKVLNGGCTMQINAPIPAGEPLQLTGQLESVDDNGKRVILRTRVTTSTTHAPDALVATMQSYIPLASGGSDGKGSRKARPRVPSDGREIALWHLKPSHARTFAMLTGDINPVHWAPPYAKAMGFKSTILHGFATMARSIEGLNRALFSHDVTKLGSFEARFTRPLVLPKKVGLYVDGQGGIYVGDSPGGPAYMVGRFASTSRQETSP